MAIERNCGMRLDEMERLDIHTEDDDGPVETETNGDITRYTYKDGTTGWKTRDRFLTESEQERLEEAYGMGMRAARLQNTLAAEMAQQNIENAYCKGAFNAAYVIANSRGKVR